MSEAPGHEMPFLDHLEELRKRLFWIAGAVVVGVVLAFVLLSKLDIIRVLERPIEQSLLQFVWIHAPTLCLRVVRAAAVSGAMSRRIVSACVRSGPAHQTEPR